jgi:hypothetical protein
MRMHLQADRGGFALPMTVLLIGLMTAGVMAAFSRVDSERRVVENSTFQVSAFALAQAGLEQALARSRIQPLDSTYVLPGGAAQVSIRLVKPGTATTQPLYVISSRGLPRKPAVQVQAQHVVAQYAFWRQGSIKVNSAWTSIGGLIKNGGSGTLSGADQCGQAPSVAGVAVPNGEYNQDGGGSVPSGDPPINYMGTPQQMADSVRIDWAAIVNGGAIQPDVLIPGGAWPSFASPNYWPVIRVDNLNGAQFSMPTSGRGTLIVTGDMVISGGLTWDGIVLVGGALISNGNNTVYGTAISGLNVKLGLPVPVSDVGNGTKTFQYDSCSIANAAARFSALQALPNAWADNWSTF